MIRIKDIKIRENLSDEEVLKIAISKQKIKQDEIEEWYIYKKSIDARKKEDVHYNYSFNIKLKDKKRERKFEKIEETFLTPIKVSRKSNYRPVIVGTGPAGLFAALTLIENGIKPIVLERGKKVEDRIEDVNNFNQNRKINVKSNVQFGEGGAGTFSDGKLNTGNTSIYSM